MCYGSIDIKTGPCYFLLFGRWGGRDLLCALKKISESIKPITVGCICMLPERKGIEDGLYKLDDIAPCNFMKAYICCKFLPYFHLYVIPQTIASRRSLSTNRKIFRINPDATHTSRRFSN